MSAVLVQPEAANGNTNGRTFYVNYDGGSDDADGRTPATAFERAPGDPQAQGNAAATALEAGDTVRFKGGVVYRGEIDVRWSGAEGAPITYDGNTAGDWGEGRAIIDGSEPVEGWQRVASAREARGNPNWQNLYWARVPGDADVQSINLIQEDQLLSIARDPSPRDPFFVDELGTMRHIRPPLPQTRSLTRIESPGLHINASHPLEMMLDGGEQTFAIVDPMEGARITFVLPEPRTVHRLVISGHTRSTRAKDIAFSGDGRELVAATMKEEGGRHEYELDEPVRIESLTLEIRSIYGGDEHKYGAVRLVQALDEDGQDVLRMGGAEPYTAYADPTYFTQEDPDAWKGAIFAIWAQPNRVYYQRVLGYDAANHEIRFEALTARQYEGDRGRFSLLNAMVAITEPGEYYLDPDVDDEGYRRIYVWPLETGHDGPQGMTISRRADLFSIRGGGHIVIQGFIIQKQGGQSSSRAIHSAGGTKHLIIRDNEIRYGQSISRDAVIAVVHGEHVRIEDNHIHHNRNARGLRLTISDSVVTRNRLHRNGSTGIGFFGSKRTEMTHNTVTGHTGVHANGLTVYADSEDILVEGNRSWDNGHPLTLQNSANVTVRNNILHWGGNVVGIWTGWHRNLRFEHNLLLGAEGGADWTAALFTNSDDIDGLHVHNNIMSGTSGNLPGEFGHNIYTRFGPNDDPDNLPEGSIYVPDLNALFVDVENRDFRPRPDSPAINAGRDVGVTRDIDGNPRPQGTAPDIGPYEKTPDSKSQAPDNS